jgi:small-conductance mechanosensitive channel
MRDLSTSGLALSPWVLAPAAFVLWVAVLLVARRIALAAMRRVASRTRWAWDDALVEGLSTPLLIAILASGLVLLGRILPLQPEFDRAFDVVLAAAIVLALVLFVDRTARALLDRLAPDSPFLQGARGLILAGVRGLIVGLGILVFLDSIGISITPILASLGVGSLAVALALQETLANLFAGVYMVIDKPIEPGHFIRLESGEEGVVTRVGWRSTRILMQPNNTVVVPNSKLAGSVIVNYDQPEPELAVYVELGVHYDSDLARVERVTLEVAREVMRTVAGGVPAAEPGFRYHTFAESGIRLTAVLRARDFPSTYPVRHEFIKRLVDRYRREGIVIPYPIRTLDLPARHLSGARELLGGGEDAGGRRADREPRA